MKLQDYQTNLIRSQQLFEFAREGLVRGPSQQNDERYQMKSCETEETTRTIYGTGSKTPINESKATNLGNFWEKYRADKVRPSKRMPPRMSEMGMRISQPGIGPWGLNGWNSCLVSDFMCNFSF